MKIQKIHSKDSPVELVEVVVEEVGGTVEREGGDWEVGGTDEVGGEGVADSAAAGRKAVLIRAPSECTYNRRVVLSPETNRVC